MQVGVVGMNHRIADLKLREALAMACQQGFGSIAAKNRSGSYVILSTCNRTEVYFASKDLVECRDSILEIIHGGLESSYDQRFYSYFGVECFEHLARVTAGLDSAIVGETEIQGQVKLAYEGAGEEQQLPTALHYMFQKALKIGKQVRTSLGLQRAQFDLEHAVLASGKSIFPNIEDCRVLFVGASEINRKILAYFQTMKLARLALCNRSREKAQGLAASGGIDVIDWGDRGRWTEFDWVIFCTKSPQHILGLQDVPKQLATDKLLIDLSVPRNVDPLVANHAQISLMNIDEVTRMMQHRRSVLGASIVEAEAKAKALAQRQAGLFLDKEKARQQWLAVSA